MMKKQIIANGPLTDGDIFIPPGSSHSEWQNSRGCNM